MIYGANLSKIDLLGTSLELILNIGLCLINIITPTVLISPKTI